jgi:hypothetical protein
MSSGNRHSFPSRSYIASPRKNLFQKSYVEPSTIRNDTLSWNNQELRVHTASPKPNIDNLNQIQSMRINLLPSDAFDRLKITELAPFSSHLAQLEESSSKQQQRNNYEAKVPIIDE